MMEMIQIGIKAGLHRKTKIRKKVGKCE